MAVKVKRFQTYRHGVLRFLTIESPTDTTGEKINAALIRGDNRYLVGEDQGVAEGDDLLFPIVFNVDPGMYELEVYGDAQGIVYPQNDTTIRVLAKNNEYND